VTRAAGEMTVMRSQLERYRYFQECLLREVRLTRFGTELKFEFDYVWARNESADWRIADRSSVVVVKLGLVEAVEMNLPVPEALVDEPERANWGLSEIALVQVEQAPQSRAVRAASLRPRYRLVVKWEGDRRIIAVFGRLTIEDHGTDTEIA
jgi:hypothetical protein